MHRSTSPASPNCNRRFPDLDLILIESGGDNLAATFSPELADLTIYVIDVSAGDKIPRKGGPGITRSDLLVINKIDLAPFVGASLEVMDRDARKMRGDRPFVFANIRAGKGVRGDRRVHRNDRRPALTRAGLATRANTHRRQLHLTHCMARASRQVGKAFARPARGDADREAHVRQRRMPSARHPARAPPGTDPPRAPPRSGDPRHSARRRIRNHPCAPPDHSAAPRSAADMAARRNT